MKPSSPAPLWALLVILVAGALLFLLVIRPNEHRVERVHVAGRLAPQEATSATPSPRPPTPTPAPAAGRAGGARLAIIIDDCGQWLRTERGFVALSIPLTLSVLPDVRYGSLISSEAAAAGKGVMLHLPMETLSGLNPGRGKVTTEMTDAQIAAQVDADLAQVPLAQGVNNHEGSKATADARVMRDVADALKKHGDLFFVDSMTIADSVAAAQARDAGLPTASRDVFLDNRAEVAYTEAQLQKAGDDALARGSAIAIGHPRPTTLAALRLMIPKLQSQGISFVLVSSLVQAPSQPQSEPARSR